MGIDAGGTKTDCAISNGAELLGQATAGSCKRTRVGDETARQNLRQAILHAAGAPGDWLAALKSWNDYPPEIAEVTQLVAQYTNTARGQGGASAAAPITRSKPPILALVKIRWTHAPSRTPM